MRSPPIKKKPKIMNLRFELTIDEHGEFWRVGRKVLKIYTKKDILLKMIELAKRDA